MKVPQFISDYLQAQLVIENEIEKIIGTKSSNIVLELDSYWSINGTELYIADSIEDFNNEEYYVYEISSLGSRCEELFLGEKDGLMCVSAYDDDDSWYNAVVYILDMSKAVDYNSIF